MMRCTELPHLHQCMTAAGSSSCTAACLCTTHHAGCAPHRRAAALPLPPRPLALLPALPWPCRSRQLVTGNPTLGYDVGTVTSLALVGVAGPRAQATQEAAAVAMTALGGASAACQGRGGAHARMHAALAPTAAHIQRCLQMRIAGRTPATHTPAPLLLHRTPALQAFRACPT